MECRRNLNHLELLTVSEKDEQYVKRWLIYDVQRLAQKCLGIRQWIKFKDSIESLAKLGYLSMTTLANISTPGEEFCEAEINPDTQLSKRLLMALLTYDVSFIPRELKIFKKLISDIHMVTFFLFGDFYELSKRICDIQITTRLEHNSSDQLISTNSIYRLLGILTLIRMFLANEYITTDRPNQMDEKQMQKETGSSANCQLCSEPRSSATSTICGHIFCWICIHKWLQQRSECPICRTPTDPSRLIYLINFR